MGGEVFSGGQICKCTGLRGCKIGGIYVTYLISLLYLNISQIWPFIIIRGENFSARESG